METVQFHAIVDTDQVIRPPEGVELPRGEVEVTVRSHQPEAAASSDSLASTLDWLLALAAEAEQAAPDLPGDMAANHDHYAHGKPRP